MSDDKNASVWHCDDCAAGKSHAPPDPGISPAQLREKVEALEKRIADIEKRLYPYVTTPPVPGE